MIFSAEQLAHQHHELLVVFYYQHRARIIVKPGVLAFVRQLLGSVVGQVEDVAGRYLDLYVVLFVNLRGRESFLADGQVYGESGSLAFYALAVYGAFVQIHQVAGQRQPQSCAESLATAVVAVVEA